LEGARCRGFETAEVRGCGFSEFEREAEILAEQGPALGHVEAGADHTAAIGDPCLPNPTMPTPTSGTTLHSTDVL
jgi:hypothetical protein